MNISVRVENLFFGYGKEPVIKGMNQIFTSGRITGVLGHNGCGKSTLMKNILGYFKTTSGSISFFNGKKPLSDSISRSQIVSLVPQKPGNLSSERVFDLIQMGRLPYIKSRWAGFTTEDRKKTDEIIELLNIGDFRDRRAGSLSGGEQQKIILARTLVQDTPVILMDEATANLDMQHKVDIMDKIRERVIQKGITVIAVMHDMNLAAHYCNEILFMKDGKTRYYGPPSEVITSESIFEVYGLRTSVHTDENGVPFILPGRGSQSREGCYVS